MRKKMIAAAVAMVFVGTMISPAPSLAGHRGAAAKGTTPVVKAHTKPVHSTGSEMINRTGKSQSDPVGGHSAKSLGTAISAKPSVLPTTQRASCNAPVINSETFTQSFTGRATAVSEPFIKSKTLGKLIKVAALIPSGKATAKAKPSLMPLVLSTGQSDVPAGPGQVHFASITPGEKAAVSPNLMPGKILPKDLRTRLLPRDRHLMYPANPGGLPKLGQDPREKYHEELWTPGNPSNPFTSDSFDPFESENPFGSGYNPLDPFSEGYSAQGVPPEIPAGTGGLFTGAAQHGATEGTGSGRSGDGPAPSGDGKAKQGGGPGTQQCDSNEGKYYDQSGTSQSGNSRDSGGLEQDPTGKDPFYHGRDALEVKASDGSSSLRACSVDGDGGGKATQAMLWLKSHLGRHEDNDPRPNGDTRGVKIDRIQEFNAMTGGRLTPERGFYTDNGGTVDEFKYYAYLAGIGGSHVNWDAKTQHGKLPMDPLVK